MSKTYFDTLETRDAIARERAQFALFPDVLRRALADAPGWATHLAGIEPGEISSRAALAQLPILRKASRSFCAAFAVPQWQMFNIR